jgi:ribonuclease D
MVADHVLLADTPALLAQGLGHLADLAVVGVDVERADWDRYWRAAALVQVGGQGRVVLVDPLELDDVAALDEFLGTRTVVLHAMENDLGPLAGLGVAPAVVEDTAIAAALLGLATGLETLLVDLLGVTLPGDKQAMQRADWEQRPLSPEMIAYAADDVADLPALWTELERRLEAAGRMGWYREEVVAALALPPAEQRRDWTRTKGAGRLDPLARSRLRALWDTREELARSTNTAPGRIVADRLLVELATAPPAALHELARRGMRRQAVRQFGAALLDAIAAGDAAGPAVAPRRGRVPSDADRANADRLRALRADVARNLGVDAGVLCPSRTLLTALLTDPQTPEELRESLGLRPWQWAQLGEVFWDALKPDGAGKAADDG